MELFHAIQTIAAKIKASRSLALLENDKDYMALVTIHLPKEIAWKWCHKDLSGWSSFFNFLEKEAKVAKKMITNESINSALSGATDKPQKCTMCHKNHPGKCQKTKTTAMVQGADKTCPVYSKQAHKYKTESGAKGISKRIKDCPGFKAATIDQKQEMVKKIKIKNPVCSKCSNWSHSDDSCNWKGTCVKCNEVHIHHMCSTKKYFS